MDATNIQRNILNARLADLQAELDERIARFEWVLEALGDPQWAERLLEQCVRLEREVEGLQSRLARL